MSEQKPREAADNIDRADGSFTNHLAGETSPYLKQHASNPVDWYPWGDEALERARRENKPIFLSIGYSACHWCHVMERESFTDPAVAAILNENFISIKVDREERPDVDEIYMTAVQILTRSGGWPLNVFLTPDLQPFFGGTYFPPVDGYGRPGFSTLIRQIATVWREQPDQVQSSAANLTSAIRTTVDRVESGDSVVDRNLLEKATTALRRSFDQRWGGFGGAPKFPPTGSISVLLRQYRHTSSPDLLEMATLTLDHMAQGGMHDHVGGGFHRYSVDEEWLVPHFEKMLYDNALLARVYLEATLVTGRDAYRRVARNTLDFVLRDMADSAGGFHCALDADSEGEEGRFYVWTPQQIEAVLGAREGAIFCEYFGVTEAGNFEVGNILHYTQASVERAQQHFDSPEELEQNIERWCESLRRVRAERVWPGKDDKVLASWNGMMISALARGYAVLKDDRYLEAAIRAAGFVLTQMHRDGKLLHSYSPDSNHGKRGSDDVPGFLDDYAEVANGLIDLYEVSLDIEHLESATLLVRRLIDEFHDPDEGGFFFTSQSHDHVLVRTKPYHDGAVPSGNSTAAFAVLQLSRLLDDENMREKAVGILRNACDFMATHPEAFTHLLCAVDFHLDVPLEIVLAGERNSQDTNRLADLVHEGFHPNKTFALADAASDYASEVLGPLPLLEGKQTIDGAASAYVCRGNSCAMPVTGAEDLRRLLAKGD